MILIFEEIIYKNFFFLYNIKYFFNSYIMFQIVQFILNDWLFCWIKQIIRNLILHNLIFPIMEIYIHICKIQTL